MILPVPALCAALALGAGPFATVAVSAEQLPFRGAFGAVTENGCKSYREQAEGHYIETYGNGGAIAPPANAAATSPASGRPARRPTG